MWILRKQEEAAGQSPLNGYSTNGGLTSTLYPIITKTEQPREKRLRTSWFCVFRQTQSELLTGVSPSALWRNSIKTEGFYFLFHINMLTGWGCRTCSAVYSIWNLTKTHAAFSSSIFVLRRYTFSSSSLTNVVREHNLWGCLQPTHHHLWRSADWLQNFFFTNFEVTGISGWQELTQGCWNHLLLSPIISDFL